MKSSCVVYLNIYVYQILAEENVDENDIRDVVMLIGMLSNYNKYESRNPYLSYLTKCKQIKPFEVVYRVLLYQVCT